MPSEFGVSVGDGIVSWVATKIVPPPLSVKEKEPVGADPGAMVLVGALVALSAPKALVSVCRTVIASPRSEVCKVYVMLMAPGMSPDALLTHCQLLFGLGVPKTGAAAAVRVCPTSSVPEIVGTEEMEGTD